MYILIYLFIGYIVSSQIILYSLFYKDKIKSTYDQYNYLTILITTLLLLPIAWPLFLFLILFDLIIHGKTLQGM